MSLWLLDASVLLASEDLDDEHHEASGALLRGADPLATLDLAFYEVTNVAIRAWRDPAAADRLRERIDAIIGDGGLVRADSTLLEHAAAVAEDHGISVYDASFVAAADRAGGRLVSCDIRDLVSRGLAVLPGDVRATHHDEGLRNDPFGWGSGTRTP